jgi:hypothetical protein
LLACCIHATMQNNAEFLQLQAKAEIEKIQIHNFWT